MNENTRNFFAAANGFDGFVSYFNEIFNPREYEKIFILKGGPGTGKSSFLKNVIQSFQSKDSAHFEVIFCSSDPKSLDGVIIEKNGRKIALLDGTAPHITDPIFPGAVEKIINLGDSWNESLLENNSDIIKKLANSKAMAYQNAYEYLAVAKICDTLVSSSVKKAFSLIEDKIINDIFDKNNRYDTTIKIIPLNAFGKQGFFELAPTSYNFDRAFQVVGIYGSEYLFMNEVFNLAKRYSQKVIISPSPLDKNKIDSIYLEQEKTYIYIGKKFYKENTITVDTSKYIDLKSLDINKNKIETLYKEREAMLWCATDEFSKAYTAHDGLEKIYSAAMNFKKNDKLLKKVCQQINSILFEEDLNTQIP